MPRTAAGRAAADPATERSIAPGLRSAPPGAERQGRHLYLRGAIYIQFAARVRGGPEGFQVEQRAATGAAFNGLTRAVKGRFEQYDPSGPRGSRECPEQPQAELRQIPPQSGPSHPACARRPLAPSARGAIYI